MIRMLLWDVDGTILDFLAAEKVAIRKCFDIFGLGECTDEMLAEYSDINLRHWKMLERQEITKDELLVARFREFFGNHEIICENLKAFNDEYQFRLGDTIVFHENAFETIRSLKGKYVQCAVTNGTKVAQDRKLKASGLQELFDYAFISEEVGAEKPSVKFFDAVTERTGISMSEAMIIGDSLTSDMQGGNNADIVTCWYNPEGNSVPADMRIDYDIRDFGEIAAILE
ncbi:MAG: YjjG family noncanonical pyrimidine nucleotidase [Clostridia bacterium]|nr:YjjG family noncanonical pyrimidine nucleotidase [Clostridia bacterium]